MIEATADLHTSCAGCARTLDLTQPHVALDLRIERLEAGKMVELGLVELLADWCSQECFASKQTELLELSEGALACASCGEPIDPSRNHVSLRKTLCCHWDGVEIPLNEALVIVAWCTDGCFAAGRQDLVDALK